MIRFSKWLSMVALPVVLTAGVAFAGGNVVIKGSTTVLPIAQAALESYMKLHPGVNISLSGGGVGRRNQGADR